MKNQITTSNSNMYQNTTVLDLGLVVDKSMSMQPLKSVVIDGFNALIGEQSDATMVSTLFFNADTQMVHNGVPREYVNLITGDDYKPGGSTALLDGIGEMMREIGTRYDILDEKPRVIISVLTDGFENSSENFLVTDIAELISARLAQGWEFIYFCTSPGKDYARRLNIPESSIKPINTTPEKLVKLIGKASKAIRTAIENKVGLMLK